MSTIAIVLAGGMSSGQRCAKAEHVVLLKSMVSKISIIKALVPPCPTCRSLGVADEGIFHTFLADTLAIVISSGSSA
jgi:hypothetical protein